MSGDRPHAVVFVAGEDEHAERMTRSLGGEFEAVDGLEVGYAYEVASESAPGTKGPGALGLLHLALDWGWPVAAPLIATVIDRWSRRSAGETVVVRVGRTEIRIEGGITAEQAAELEAELGKNDE